MFEDPIILKQLQQIQNLLLARHWKVCVAESLTSGAVLQLLTQLAGSSNTVYGGFVSYQTVAKQQLLGVKQQTIANYSVVSAPVVTEMLNGCLQYAEVACATSGVAGPAHFSDAKPVGTVFIGTAILQQTWVEQHHFKGNRQQVIQQAVAMTITQLATALKSVKNECE